MKLFRIKPTYTEIEDMAREIVLFYFQSNGQGLEGRINTLNKAVAFVGIKAEFYQKDESNAGWGGKKTKHLEKAKQFRKDLDGCFPRGQFEWEMSAVEGVLNDYLD